MIDVTSALDGSLRRVAQQLAQVACSDEECCGVLVYGSRVDGTASSESDLDILVLIERGCEQKNIIHRHGELLAHMQLMGRERLSQLCVRLAKNFIPEIVCYGTVLFDPHEIFQDIRRMFSENKLHFRLHHILEHHEALAASLSRVEKGFDTGECNIFDAFGCIEHLEYLRMCLLDVPIRRCFAKPEAISSLFSGSLLMSSVAKRAHEGLVKMAPYVIDILEESVLASEGDCSVIERTLAQRLRHTYLFLERIGSVRLSNGNLPDSMKVRIT